MVVALARRFPDLPTWPASAQLAVLSLAWACGPGFRFPKTEAAIRTQDWATAAEEGVINSVGNPGVIPRNKANRQLFLAAAHVVAIGGDRSVLLMAPPEELSEAERQRTLGLVGMTLDASIRDRLASDRREHGGES